MNLDKLAKRFDKGYDPEWEASAAEQRREFRRRFPLRALKTMTLEQYAIGQNKGESYCHWLETGTREVARIAGSPATRFGIYYGVSKKNAKPSYRYTKRYRNGFPVTGAEQEVFKVIKGHWLDLIKAGGDLQFEAIDSNPLAPIVKAKALCLHFPEKYMAICSNELLLELSQRLGLETDSCSEIQHRALQIQEEIPQAAAWSQFKFMDFVYSQVLGRSGPSETSSKKQVRAGSRKSRTVDFRRLMELWARVGKESEAIAWKHEVDRLRREGLPEYVPQMEDCTNMPSRGYDFASFTDAETPRFIEVKTFTEVKPGEYRFFLSRNEKNVSESAECRDEYYFYLVMFDQEGVALPKKVKMEKASDFYKEVDLEAQGYVLKWPL